MFWKNTDEKLARRLHKAMGTSDLAVISKLIGMGANPALNIKFAKGGYEGNALHAHAVIRHTNYPERDREAVSYILSRGVDISAGNSMGETPLHLALRIDDKNTYIDDCINCLIDHRANVSAKTVDGQTPMHYLVSALEADMRWQKRALKRLISEGANINAQDSDGLTPLMLAAIMGVRQTCELLLEYGADIHICADVGKTACDFAEEEGHSSLAEFLYEKQKTTKMKIMALPVTPIAPVIVSAPAVLADELMGWSKQDDHKIACVTVEQALGYKITEIFNFKARTYVCLSQNIKTSAEALVHKTFDDFADKGALLTALEQLRLRGGAADEGVLYSRSLQKSAPKLHGGQ